jgi:hypothetical protein
MAFTCTLSCEILPTFLQNIFLKAMRGLLEAMRVFLEAVIVLLEAVRMFVKSVRAHSKAISVQRQLECLYSL